MDLEDLFTDAEMDLNLRFLVTKPDGSTYKDSDLWIPKSSIFNPRCQFAQAFGAEAWLFTAFQAVSKYDANFGVRARGNSTKRIVYAGPSGTHNGVAINAGNTLFEIRKRTKAVEQGDVKDLVAQLLSLGDVRAAESLPPMNPASDEELFVNAAASFAAAADNISETGGHMASVFCGFLDDSYYNAKLSATTTADDALTLSALATAAANALPSPFSTSAANSASHVMTLKDLLFDKACTNVRSSKQVIASRVVQCFPSILPIISAALASNVSATESQHVVIASCFTIVEKGLCSNVLTRGAIGPECPVCLESFDTSSEDLPLSPVILGCVFPLDYAHGAMHPICKGCWGHIRYMASLKGSAGACPICRALTTGNTISQCAYNVMIDLVVI